MTNISCATAINVIMKSCIRTATNMAWHCTGKWHCLAIYSELRSVSNIPADWVGSKIAFLFPSQDEWQLKTLATSTRHTHKILLQMESWTWRTKHFSYQNLLMHPKYFWNFVDFCCPIIFTVEKFECFHNYFTLLIKSAAP